MRWMGVGVWFGICAAVIDAKPWRVEDYPDPRISKWRCNTATDQVCDPDSVLSMATSRKVEAALQNLTATVRCGGHDHRVLYQVAAVNQIDYPDGTSAHEAAWRFAYELFYNRWAPRASDACTQNNRLMLFFALGDSQLLTVFGSTLKPIPKSTLQQIAPSERLDTADWVVQVLRGIDRLVEPKRSFPTLCGSAAVYVLAWLIVAGLILYVWHDQWRDLWAKRERRSDRNLYCQPIVLSEQEEQQARELQSRYRTTECAICLCEFRKPSIGSDGQPVILLRCGHAFDRSCWKLWMNQCHEEMWSKCPFCLDDRQL